jgi:hypothetical protein
MAKKVHVVPTDEGFGVKISGNSKNSKNFETKSEAIEYGRERAKEMKTELVIQNKDGKISNTNSHGNDPNPPKDKKR